MKERLLEPELYRKGSSEYPESLCDGRIVVSYKDGWRYFDCAEIGYENNNKMNKSIAVKDYGVVNQERETKLKNIVKRVLCPQYRRYCRISRYLEKGYSHQEALARADVIEVI
ncbi:MAG: hypothetical protein PHQ43_08115 [Dehalococcoidales bacterium]|nr:hypothetical protein [Dehalococcoidales bacterium]